MQEEIELWAVCNRPWRRIDLRSRNGVLITCLCPAGVDVRDYSIVSFHMCILNYALASRITSAFTAMSLSLAGDVRGSAAWH